MKLNNLIPTVTAPKFAMIDTAVINSLTSVLKTTQDFDSVFCLTVKVLLKAMGRGAALDTKVVSEVDTIEAESKEAIKELIAELSKLAFKDQHILVRELANILYVNTASIATYTRYTLGGSVGTIGELKTTEEVYKLSGETIRNQKLKNLSVDSRAREAYIVLCDIGEVIYLDSYLLYSAIRANLLWDAA